MNNSSGYKFQQNWLGLWIPIAQASSNDFTGVDPIARMFKSYGCQVVDHRPTNSFFRDACNEFNSDFDDIIAEANRIKDE